MKRVTLKRLILSGRDKNDSIIEFYNGLNLVIGPSNTGKSLILDCIDYMFGAAAKNNTHSKILDNQNGYSSITLELDTAKGNIILKRKIGGFNIEVLNQDGSFTEYPINGKGEQNANHFFLKLLGINPPIKVVKNKNGNTTQLTWRGLLHLFLLKQLEIARENSILLSPILTSQTASKSILLFLLTKIDGNDIKPTESTQITEAKRSAVLQYILAKENILKDRINKISETLQEHPNGNIEHIIDELTQQLELIKKALNEAITNSKMLTKIISEKSEKLTETATLLQNFKNLEEQYNSDINRIEFILKGQFYTKNYETKCQCPICDSIVDNSLSVDCTEAAKTELILIKTRLEELKKVQTFTSNQIQKLKDEIDDLVHEKNEIEERITTSLHPAHSNFKADLQKYTNIIEYKKEADILKGEIDSYKYDFYNKEHEKMLEPPPFIFEKYFSLDIVHKFEEILNKIIYKSRIEGITPVKFNLKTFDIELNHKMKSSCMGGGYCAILNAITAYAMQTLIFTKEGYSPGFIIMDSALTQLSEGEHIEYRNTIKHNFVKTLIEDPISRQVIMFEHKEDLDYLLSNEELAERVHIIEFTKNPTQGRYGFLNEVYDSDDEK